MLNVLGFLPLGFVMVPAMPSRLARGTCVLLTVLLCSLLSLGLETLQNFLPTRVPSDVDLGCNALGALLGALAGAHVGHDLSTAAAGSTAGGCDASCEGISATPA